MQSLGAKVFLLACVLAIATSDKKVVDSDKNVADSDKKVVDWEDSTLTFRKQTLCKAGRNGCLVCTKDLNGCLKCFTRNHFVLNGNECNHNSQPNHGVQKKQTSGQDCTGFDEHCQTCNTTECMTCFAEYYVRSNKCELCNITIPYCLKCDNNPLCSLCSNGTYVTANKSCAMCSDRDKNCLSCTIDVCSVCKEGYYTNGNSTTCTDCGQAIQYCIKCNSGTNCETCAEGRIISDDHTTCDEKSVTVIIIVASVVGAVALIGVGFAIFKCLRKKKSVNILQDEDYEKL